MAGLFSVTEKAVRGWIAAGMPVVKAGTQGGAREKTEMDLEECVRWYFETNHERLELDRQRTRLASEQAQKIAIENALSISGVGELKVWKEELEKLLGEIRSALLAMPSKQAPQLDGDVNQRKDRLERAVHEILRQLAAYQPIATATTRTADDSAGGDGAEPAAPANRKRVGRRVPKAVKGKQRRARRVED
jgi:phage terminase Nu1 subunit (DNA packaging protein)